ncbi:MBL fold metallo-hydrolase [Peribacillus sp. SCS-37]|uniref:MBL fold metallo-hydrolase n=1 Tax=Paraperibacillus esterisolvens TaxID=3115296 RepID=UPI003906A7A6
MDYLLERAGDGIYALAIWDSSWNSYNNCYILLGDKGVALIDCGKKEHSPYLIQALHELGRTPEDVSLLLATHGHEDHIQNEDLFPHAKKYIHPLDKELSARPDSFQALNDRGDFEGFQYELAGFHSPGSVILFHKESRTLFSGDFLCFFGDPLPKGRSRFKGQ